MERKLSVILAATDLSRAGDAAARRAAWLAKGRGARLEIVHVLARQSLTQAWAWLQDVAGISAADVRSRALQRLHDLAAHVVLETDVSPEIHLAEGRPYVEIAARAEAVGADLVVIGAHGENAVLDLFVGTTAQRVMRASRRPVLLVKQTPPFPYGDILLPADFSPAAREASDFAKQLFPNARLTLLHVYENPFARELEIANASEETFERYRRLAEADARAALEAFRRAAGLDEKAVACKLRFGHPPSRINEFARERDVDLIVIAPQRRSPLEQAILGSVSEHIVMESHCDVLLVGVERVADDLQRGQPGDDDDKGKPLEARRGFVAD